MSDWYDKPWEARSTAPVALLVCMRHAASIWASSSHLMLLQHSCGGW